MVTIKLFQVYYYLFENFHNKHWRKKLDNLYHTNRNVTRAINLSHIYNFLFSVAIKKKKKQVKLMLTIYFTYAIKYFQH